MPPILRRDTPEPGEYCALRLATGLSPMLEEAAADALPRSLCAVTVRDEGRLIGMGRVVGDGLHVQVVDIAVHPDFQGRGVGAQVMAHLTDYVSRELPDCAQVTLFADVDWFYQKYGFRLPKRSVGMIRPRHTPER